MGRLRYLVCLFAMAVLATPALAQRAESCFKARVKAETRGNMDAAYEAYRQAHEKKPAEPKYSEAFLRTRLSASEQHIQTGQGLRDVYKLQEALTEFRRAAQIDSSNFAAFQEIRRTTDLINKREALASEPPQIKARASVFQKAADSAAGPVTLNFRSNDTVSLHMVSTTDVVYKTIGKLAGLNVFIDPEQTAKADTRVEGRKPARCPCDGCVAVKDLLAACFEHDPGLGGHRGKAERVGAERNDDVLPEECRDPGGVTAGGVDAKGHP